MALFNHLPTKMEHKNEKIGSILKLSIKSHPLQSLAQPLTNCHPLNPAPCTTSQDWAWNSKSGDVSPKIRDGISLSLFFVNLKARAHLGLWWAIFLTFFEVSCKFGQALRKEFQLFLVQFGQLFG